jgi:hypothetical protein
MGRATPDPRMTSYLLGDLSEPEVTALERDFFSNPEVFARLVQAETALVDDYVRRRLPPQLKARFEQHYLSDARRLARVEFAEALATKIDEVESAEEARPSGVRARWQVPLFTLGAGGLWRMSVAAALALLFASTGWLLLQSRRLRGELAQSETARARDEQRTRDLQGQLLSEQTTARELASELERLKGRSGTPTFQSATSSTPTLVSLLLTVPSARAADAGAPSTLAISPETREVRVQLAMDDAAYASYQVSLNAVAGPVVFTRPRLTPRKVDTGVRVAVTVPADRLAAGDYMLTLSGERSGAPPEAVSQLLIRVVTASSPR